MAARHLRDALALQEAELGPSDPALASTLNNLGVVSEHLQDFEEAERCYRRAFAIVTTALPSDDALVETSRANLSEFCAARGIDLEKAQPAPETLPPAPVPTPLPVVEPPPRVAPTVAAKERAEVVTPRREAERAAARPSLGLIAGMIVLVIGLIFVVGRSKVIAPPAAEPAVPPVNAAAPAPPVPAPPVPAPPVPTPPTLLRQGSGGSLSVVSAELCRALTTSGEWKCTPPGDEVSGGTLFFYTRVASARPTTVVHRWYRDEKMQWSRELQIQPNVGAGYRVYSRMTVGAGQWRVELRTTDGQVLREDRFTVK